MEVQNFKAFLTTFWKNKIKTKETIDTNFPSISLNFLRILSISYLNWSLTFCIRLKLICLTPIFGYDINSNNLTNLWAKWSNIKKFVATNGSCNRVGSLN
jgi:hypothetical protein